MKTVKFTIKDSPVTQAKFDGKSVVMTFKSGNTYEFSTQNYIKGAKAELRRFSG